MAALSAAEIRGAQAALNAQPADGPPINLSLASGLCFGQQHAYASCGSLVEQGEEQFEGDLLVHGSANDVEQMV